MQISRFTCYCNVFFMFGYAFDQINHPISILLEGSPRGHIHRWFKSYIAFSGIAHGLSRLRHSMFLTAIALALPIQADSVQRLYRGYPTVEIMILRAQFREMNTVTWWTHPQGIIIEHLLYNTFGCLDMTRKVNFFGLLPLQ